MPVVAIVAVALLSSHLPVDDVLDRKYTRGSRQGRGAADASVELWPKCEVPYVVVEEAGCGAAFAPELCVHAANVETAAVIRAAIEEASAELEHKTGCRFYEDPAANRPVAVTSKENACYVNHVGRLLEGTNVMNLGKGWCSNNVAHVKHELLHVLGVEHEHQSPLSANMLVRCSGQDCTSQRTIRNCLVDEAVESWELTNYDPLSIMHYPLKGMCNLELTEAGMAVLVAAGVSNPDVVGRVSTISDGDAALVRKLYSNELPPPAPQPQRSGTAPRTSSGSDGGSGISTGAIAAAAVGGALLLIAVALVVFSAPTQSSRRYAPIPANPTTPK